MRSTADLISVMSRTLASGRNGDVVETESLDAPGIRITPVCRIVEETSRGCSIGGFEEFGAIVESFPARQALTHVDHVGRHIPGFLRLELGNRDDGGLTGFQMSVPGITDIGTPDFQCRVDVAISDRRHLRIVSGGDVFDIVAHPLQRLAGDRGGDMLARPLVHGELDRRIRLRNGLCASRRRNSQKQGSCSS